MKNYTNLRNVDLVSLKNIKNMNVYTSIQVKIQLTSDTLLLKQKTFCLFNDFEILKVVVNLSTTHSPSTLLLLAVENVICVLVYLAIIYLWKKRNEFVEKEEEEKGRCANIEEIKIESQTQVYIYIYIVGGQNEY